MVPSNDPEGYLPGDVIEQFHVLYRFENHGVGQPSYPMPETWGTLATYLGVMVPLPAHICASEFKQGQPHPAPNMSLRGEASQSTDQVCPSCGKQSPNPNYCSSCGKAMEVIQ